MYFEYKPTSLSSLSEALWFVAQTLLFSVSLLSFSLWPKHYIITCNIVGHAPVLRHLSLGVCLRLQWMQPLSVQMSFLLCVIV